MNTLKTQKLYLALKGFEGLFPISCQNRIQLTKQPEEIILTKQPERGSLFSELSIVVHGKSELGEY